jgi:hypothetical protein
VSGPCNPSHGRNQPGSAHVKHAAALLRRRFDTPSVSRDGIYLVRVQPNVANDWILQPWQALTDLTSADEDTYLDAASL